MNAAELRELRRQKILNNVNSRMMKITTAASGAADGNDATPLIFNTESNPNHAAWLGDEETAADDLPNSSVVHDFGESPAAPVEWLPSQKQNDPVVQDQVKSPMQRLLEHYYLHTMLVALGTFLLLKFQSGSIIFENAMIPFWTHAIADNAVRKRVKSGGMMDMLIAAMTMYGISNQALSLLADVLTILSKIFRSLVIYIFFIAFLSTVFGT